MDNLKILREEQERRLKKLSSEIKDREKALQRLEKQVRLSSDHLSSLDQGIEKLGESLYLIETSQDGKSELSTLQGQVRDLQQVVSDTQKTFQEQDKKNNDTVSDLRSQLRTSDSKVHILETRAKELEKTNQNLRSGKEDISRSLDEYRLQKDNYESLLTELRGVNEELKTETSELVVEKDVLTLEKNSLAKKNETLHGEIEKFSQIEVIPDLSGDLTDQEIKNLDLSEWDDGEVHIDSVFPWEEVIAEFEDSIDEFAKKEKKKTLPKGKLRELESLHDSLRKAKNKLEDYFKTPPVARKDLDSEISAIQDAMADVLKGTGMKRVETSRYIFSLRRTPVYYKVVSEKTAVNSLRKKKLGRFINTIETLDMAKLKTFLKNRGLTIPGLKKMTADVSIYIYEKHEEGEAELIYVVGPEGFEEDYEENFEGEVSSSGEGESSSSASSSSSESSSSESSNASENGFSEKINAPTFAYETVYEKKPKEFLSGRTDSPKKMWQGRSVDKGLKDSWLEDLNNLPVEIRSTDEGKSVERPAFVIFRMPSEYDDLHEQMVSNLKKQSDLFVKSDIGQGNRPRICVAGKIQNDQSKIWNDWWESLAEKILAAYNETVKENSSEDFYETPYDSSKSNDKQLGDDFRLVCAHFTTWKKTKGEGIKFTKEQILENAEKIVREIKERVKAGKMNYTFTPEKMKETSKELYGLIREKLPEDLKEISEVAKDSEHAALYLIAPHPEFIWNGAKTAIVKSKKFTEHINEPLYLISDKNCWGIIKLSEAKEINLKEFEERYEDHLIENYERIEWWDNKSPLYLYEVEVVEKFDPVKEVEIPQGIQVFILPKNVKFK